MPRGATEEPLGGAGPRPRARPGAGEADGDALAAALDAMITADAEALRRSAEAAAARHGRLAVAGALRTALAPVAAAVEEPFLAPRAHPLVASGTDAALEGLVEGARALNWGPRELAAEITSDARGFASLPPGVQRALRLPLAFFVTADGIVGQNLVRNFMDETASSADCQGFYAMQAHIECVHASTYLLQVQALWPRPEEQEALFAAVDELPSVRAKADWARRHMDPRLPLARRVAAFALVEGLLFQASFAVIYYIQSFFGDKMKGLVAANQLIARDEAAHMRFAAALFARLAVDRPLAADFSAMLREAVAAEEAFVRDALPEPLPGLNAELMVQYVRAQADQVAAALGYAPAFNTTNPFPWLASLALQSRANAFEVPPTSYQMPGGGGNARAKRRRGGGGPLSSASSSSSSASSDRAMEEDGSDADSDY